ncbi:MAG: haloacid dehalogenase [Chloroflexota bacterium]|nr:MAG: haloacid dehalogenase [Chloroflexota bacterium]
MSDLEQHMDKVRQHLTEKYAARERALQSSRETIRHSSNSIRAVHRGEFDRAESLIAQAGTCLAEARKVLIDHPDIFYAGFFQDAEKEYVEANATYCVISDRPIPGQEELGASDQAYLHGLGETVGELRRHLLDIIRRGERTRCEELLSTMEEIYGFLTTMDFPDGMTGGLRRTTDVARGILEKTRGDLTMALQQRDLEARLEAFEQRLSQRK